MGEIQLCFLGLNRSLAVLQIGDEACPDRGQASHDHLPNVLFLSFRPYPCAGFRRRLQFHFRHIHSIHYSVPEREYFNAIFSVCKFLFPIGNEMRGVVSPMQIFVAERLQPY